MNVIHTTSDPEGLVHINLESCSIGHKTVKPWLQSLILGTAGIILVGLACGAAAAVAGKESTKTGDRVEGGEFKAQGLAARKRH